MRLTVLVFIFMAFYACNNNKSQDQTSTQEPDECKQEDKLTPTLVNGYYGNAFDSTKFSTLEIALNNYKTKGKKDAVISGTIETVCQSKGCWFDLKGETDTQSVDFNHKFLIHKDLKGSKVSAYGYFYNDTTSIDQQIHENVDDAKTMTLEEAKKNLLAQ